MKSVCTACGDICAWAIDWAGGPEVGEVIRRERLGEHVEALAKSRGRLPRGPGRAARRRARADPAKKEEERLDIERAREDAIREVRDGDVLACITMQRDGTLGLSPEEARTCRACGAAHSLKLWLERLDSCPRCHQGRLVSDGVWDP